MQCHVMKCRPTDDLKVFVKLVEKVGPEAEESDVTFNQILQNMRLVF
jgi:hypothetical protein